MKTDAANQDLAATLFILVAAALGIYGLLNNLVLLGGAFLFAGAGILRYKRQRMAGLLTAIFGMVFSAVVFSYGIGKDMAIRDNALGNPSSSTQSAAG